MSGVWDWCHIILVVGVELDTMSGAVHLVVMTDRHSVSQNGHYSFPPWPQPSPDTSSSCSSLFSPCPPPSHPLQWMASPLLISALPPSLHPHQLNGPLVMHLGVEFRLSLVTTNLPTSQLLTLHNNSVTSLLRSLNTEF